MLIPKANFPSVKITAMENDTQRWIAEIDALNNTIRDAEKNNDRHAIENSLTADFMFCRADKSFADKETYLKGVADKANLYEYLEYINTDTKPDKGGKLAVSIIMVAASGIKAASAFCGRYRNIRFFRKAENGQWQISAWYNEKIGDGLLTLVPGGEGSINYAKETNTTDFEGTVFRESLPYLPSTPEMRAFYVKFENGARTTWHYHTEMQILFVKEGEGFVEERGKTHFNIFPGDRIYIPKNVSHRHGANYNMTMVHLAINLGETIWENAVPE